jgi:hypothetical protein
MLDCLRGRISDRKTRLFFCAFLRQEGGFKKMKKDEYPRPPFYFGYEVETAEHFADGLATSNKLAMAQQAVGLLDFRRNHHWEADTLMQMAAGTACARNVCTTAIEFATDWLLERWAPLTVRVSICQALREVVPCPFNDPPSLAPAILAWNEGTVVRMAQAIYDGYAFDLMPILADALLDAGYTDESVISHCQSGIEHARGCWVLDLILGKS